MTNTSQKLQDKQAALDKLQTQMETLQEKKKRLQAEIQDLTAKRQKEVLEEYGFATIEDLELFLMENRSQERGDEV